jgi:hypothetical protein
VGYSITRAGPRIRAPYLVFSRFHGARRITAEGAGGLVMNECILRTLDATFFHDAR